MGPLGYLFVAMLIALGATSASAQGSGIVAPGGPEVTEALSLEAHLAAWQKKMGDIDNFRVEIALTRTDNVFKKDVKYIGFVQWMKPNFARLRLERAPDPNGQDYEEVICNGKTLVVINGLEKSIIEHKLSQPDSPILSLLLGLTEKDAKDRFHVNLLSQDAKQICLDIGPRLQKDHLEFKQLNLELFGPKTKSSYLMSKIIKENPNGDMETWEFSKHQLNMQGIDESTFAYPKIPGFTERQGTP